MHTEDLRSSGGSAHGCRGWNKVGQIARPDDGSTWEAVLKNLDSMMKTLENLWKVSSRSTWLLVSAQVPISRKVTVFADSIKVNPNLIHLFSPSKSTFPYLKLQFVALLLFSFHSHPFRNDFPLCLKRVTKNYSSRVMGVVKGTLQSETSNAMTSHPIPLLNARWKLSRESWKPKWHSLSEKRAGVLWPQGR